MENEIMGIKFEKISRNKFEGTDEEYKKIVLPYRSTLFSAGYDFVTPKSLHIPAKGSTSFITNIKAKMPLDMYLKIIIRSSLGIKKNLMIKNTLSIIDADYYNNDDNEGNIQMHLYNFGNDDVIFDPGERVAQGIFTRYFITDDDHITNKKVFRSGGVGSTGK